MKVKELKNYISQELSAIYPKTEIDSFFFLLLEERLDFKRIDSVLKADLEIPIEILSQLKTDIYRLEKEEPIQYILGKTEFYGLSFLVDKNTLIPRPETEELVEWIILENKESRTKNQDRKLTVLDIGTGSGCISISLAKNLKNASISAIDISSEALKMATKNAKLNEVDIDFFEVDILKAASLNELSVRAQSRTNHDLKFDIIISNPPYVRELEKAAIKNNVLKNEPHLALFVENNNPLLFYDKIADLAKKHLSENGILFFEINQYLGKETVELLEKKGFATIELKVDLFGNDRMIRAALK